MLVRCFVGSSYNFLFDHRLSFTMYVEKCIFFVLFYFFLFISHTSTFVHTQYAAYIYTNMKSACTAQTSIFFFYFSLLFRFSFYRSALCWTLFCSFHPYVVVRSRRRSLLLLLLLHTRFISVILVDGIRFCTYSLWRCLYIYTYISICPQACTNTHSLTYAQTKASETVYRKTIYFCVFSSSFSFNDDYSTVMTAVTLLHIDLSKNQFNFINRRLSVWK